MLHWDEYEEGGSLVVCLDYIDPDSGECCSIRHRLTLEAMKASRFGLVKWARDACEREMRHELLYASDDMFFPPSAWARA